MENNYSNFGSSWQERSRLFDSTAPFTHLYTSPLETSLLVENDGDRIYILNILALAAWESEVEILAFAVMTNHLHLIIRGSLEKAKQFYDNWYKKSVRYFSAINKNKELASIKCGFTAITSLQQFISEVVYVIRNPFVVSNSVHLFAFPWCSGYLYFNKMLEEAESIGSQVLSYRDKRRLFKMSKADVPDHFRFKADQVLPRSFVNVALVEKLFGNARDFLFCALKNIEAQTELAISYKEDPHLSDDELFVRTRQLCHDKYRSDSPQNLSDYQKKELAVYLKKKYAASNKQISRLCALSLSITNQMFPLSAK